MHRFQVCVVACVLACNGHVDRKLAAIEFGPGVAPPIGLAVIRGGEDREAAQKSIAGLQGTPTTSELLLASAPGGIAARIELDHRRVADVVVDIANCDGLEARLAKSWSQFQRAPRTWSDPSTRWAADYVETATGCTLRFTHADFFGTVPTAFGLPADLKIGMSRDAALKIAPVIAAGDKTSASRVVIDAKEGVLVERSGTVRGQYYVLPRRAVEALRLAWGPGNRISPQEATERWISADARIHAALTAVDEASNASTLQLTSYVPLREWLGDGPNIAAVPSDLWTTPVVELASKHPDLKLDLEARLVTLPSVEWSGGDGTQVQLHLDEHKVPQEASVMLPYPSAQARREMLDAFQAKWGKATETKGVWSFAAGPGVVLQDAEHAWYLKIARPAT